MLDILCGESSPLYLQLFSEGLIDGSFGHAYMGNMSFGTSVFGGSSLEPQKIYEAIVLKAQELKETGISEAHFERIKRKHMGRFIRKCNSINNIATEQAEHFVNGQNLLEAFSALESLTKQEVEERLHEHIKSEQAVLSVVEGSTAN